MATDEYSIPSHVKTAIKDAGYTVDTAMESEILRWWKLYTCRDDFYTVAYQNVDSTRGSRKRLSTRPAKKVSKEWASLLLNEDTVISCDAEKANVWLSDYLDSYGFWPVGQQLIEKAYAIGTAAWALWFDIKEESTTIKIRSYDARMIVPLSWDEEGITECAFVTRVSIKGKKADQLQMHIIEDGEYHIITKWFIDSKEVYPEDAIDNFNTECKTKTFGIVKPGLENTVVDLSPYGMSVFEDATDAIKAVDMSWDAVFNEVDVTAIMVFLDDRLIDTKTHNGKKMPMPRGAKNSIFRMLRGDNTGEMLYEVFNPEIRIDPLERAFNLAAAELGSLTGFGEQYFRIDKVGGLKTATEVSSDNSVLMRSINKHENVLRGSIQDIITALLTCARIHTNADIEEDFGVVSVEFDDSIIIDTQADKAMMLSEINAGVAKRWQYAVKYYGMSPDEAKREFPDIVVEDDWYAGT